VLIYPKIFSLAWVLLEIKEELLFFYNLASIYPPGYLNLVI